MLQAPRLWRLTNNLYCLRVNIKVRCDRQTGSRQQAFASSAAPKMAASSPCPRQHTVLVGDIHGQLSKLESLWEQLHCHLGNERFSAARIVFLGDYVDRGPDSRGVIEWLSSLNSRQPGQEHIFLAGNHDFGMTAFLGLGGAQYNNSKHYKPWRKEPLLWGTDEAGAVLDSTAAAMHLQGRRWGAVGTQSHRNAFSAASTFASYGVREGDRDGLIAALPDNHKRFLASLAWMCDCTLSPDPTLPGIKRLIAVHAGLESSLSLEEQFDILSARNASSAWIEPLQGRRNVWNVPEQLPDDTLLASGHHGTFSISERRLIIDSCGGYDDRPLSAVILPGRHVVTSVSEEEPELVL